jgi:carbohydrate diacid regulator
MVIGSGLAQEIVERTMKIIPFSVNVMDARGIIIASGKPERIGDLHAGAQLALAQKGTFEVDADAMPNLPGAKRGINLPLIVRGEICGVVGISGEPEAVRQFGELVRVTAEMILEQAQLIGELQRERRYREEFVLQLVRRTGISSEGIEAWAARLGIDLRQSRAVSVLELCDERQRPDLALMDLQRVQAELATRRPEILTAVVSPHELVMIEAVDVSDPQASQPAAARTGLEALYRMCEEILQNAPILSMGISLPGVEGAAASYQAARKTAQVGRARNPQQRLFSYYDLSLPVLLASLEWGWQAEQLRRPLLQLEAFDRASGTLLKTLAVWYANNTHPVSTAKALHIHRNTLDYRLQKIGEATGLDLADTDDRLLLYVALQLRGHEARQSGKLTA